MSKLYSVSAFDMCGEYDRREMDTREEMAAVYVEFSAKYRGKVVLATNWNGADYDTDGLTDEDEQAIEDAEFDAMPRAVAQ